MNQRLLDIYTDFEQKNRVAFSKNEIEIDPMIGKHIEGVTLQIDLENNVRDQVDIYQQNLDILEPNNLFLLPKEFQHISFNQVVYWNGQYQKGLKTTWEETAEAFLAKFHALNNTLKSFSITFSKLIATSGAIIWTAQDETDELEKIRELFFQKLPFPRETTKRNHFIHTTIARYQNKLNNPQRVMDYVSQHTEQYSMNITSIILRKELIYPSIGTTELARIYLS